METTRHLRLVKRVAVNPAGGEKEVGGKRGRAKTIMVSTGPNA